MAACTLRDVRTRPCPTAWPTAPPTMTAAQMRYRRRRVSAQSSRCDSSHRSADDCCMSRQTWSRRVLGFHHVWHARQLVRHHTPQSVDAPRMNCLDVWTYHSLLRLCHSTLECPPAVAKAGERPEGQHRGGLPGTSARRGHSCRVPGGQASYRAGAPGWHMQPDLPWKQAWLKPAAVLRKVQDIVLSALSEAIRFQTCEPCGGPRSVVWRKCCCRYLRA